MSWHLVDAQKMAQQHPETFEAPDLKDLELLLRFHTNVQSIDLNVKACFEFDEEVDGCQAERMWVKVESYDGQDIHGELNNDPMLVDEWLHAGDKVTLKPRHVYDFMFDRPTLFN